jgi:5-methylcytosine-specific restriction protein A
MPRAPRHCGIQGCTRIVPSGQRCDEHRSGWATTPRTASSRRTGTRAWKQQRAKCFQRDGWQCQIKGPTCEVAAVECDHVVPAYLGGDDTLGNLQSACRPCHRARTQAQAKAARG